MSALEKAFQKLLLKWNPNISLSFLEWMWGGDHSTNGGAKLALHFSSPNKERPWMRMWVAGVCWGGTVGGGGGGVERDWHSGAKPSRTGLGTAEL